MRYISLALAVSLLVGCSTYKVITDPPGADVTINGEYSGKSPVEAKADCKTWGGRPVVDIKMPGYTPIVGQALEFEPGVKTIIADAIFFWPALFLNSQCPKDSYTLKLWPVDKVTTSK